MGRCPDVDRYALEARGRANELLDLLSVDERHLLEAWASQDGNLDIEPIISGPSRRVLTILSQTPAADAAWKSKKARPVFLREWLAARHWALTAAVALQQTARVYDTVGGPYRRAVRNAAQAASPFQVLLTVDAWLWLEMEC